MTKVPQTWSSPLYEFALLSWGELWSRSVCELTLINLQLSSTQAQKAILDTELDIISRQNEGADTYELRMKVLELKREVTIILLSQF